jgi:sugar lactone lactonase YvrE
MSFAVIKRISLIILLVLAAAFILIRHTYVETEAFPDRTSMPIMASTDLKLVADLPLPPGNIAVADNGDIFFTFHPEASPSINVAKLVNGKAEAFPSMDWQPGGIQPLAFNEVLSVRIDKVQRLWVLDNGKHGLENVRLLAFDITSGELLKSFTFARTEFSLGSHANDFQISNDGRFIIISDASILGKRPALVIYDVKNESARRVLELHESVLAGHFEPVVQGRKMTLFAAFTVNPGVDGLVLDHNNQFLYYASISADQLYRIPYAALIDNKLSATQLAAQVEAVGAKTMTDGMAMDVAGNVYLSDLENSAIVRRRVDGKLETLLKSVSIRWPDGFSNGPEGKLYFTCSSLHQVIGMSADSIAANAPYQIYKFLPPQTLQNEPHTEELLNE